MKDKFYTITELAKVLGVSRQTIYNWMKDERFPNAFEVGEGDGAIVLVPAADVEAVKKEEADKLIERLNRLGFQTAAA